MWLDLYENCHDSLKLRCYPDNGSLLDQEECLLTMFGMIRGQLYTHLKQEQGHVP